MENPQIQDTLLKIHVKHSKPIDVNDFSAAMMAIGSLYSSFVKENAYSNYVPHSSLYVEKVEEGSLVLYLCEVVSASVIPFIEGANTIIEFANYFKEATSYWAHGNGVEPNVNLQGCKDFSNVYGLIAGDNNGIVEIGAVNKNGTNYAFTNCTFNFGDANSSQNRVRKKTDELKEIPAAYKVHERVLMGLFQVRNSDSQAGNRAIIEDISKKDYPVTFISDELKDKVLHSTDNPLNKGYLVDVEVRSLKGSPVYVINALHDVMDIS